ncbi:hypothetical protein [Neptunomonas sp. XY-337]|uniref:hypothetical protein n=1 Tax=Neptunomonas sp. XY-337 TaxID=2561897 RepID=UPI001F0F2A1D|nr:hypothetical protein [Neptunomonas sp. XY-337]
MAVLKHGRYAALIVLSAKSMQIYLVGGAVRDQLLGYPVYDRDWVVVGATPEEMLNQGFKPVGADFPVFLHPDTSEEYALARTERKSGKGYKGFKYHASPDVTLEEDLSRRDLTINAMAQDSAGAIIDPFKGQQDLANRTLRHVSPAFEEDPLRVLRVARFAARYAHLGFQVAPETIQLMQKIASGDELEHLTKERVWQELERAIMERSSLTFFTVLANSHAAEKLFGCLGRVAEHQAATALAATFSEQTEGPVRFASFAYLAQLHTRTSFETLYEKLRMPNAYRDLTQQVATAYPALTQWESLSPEQRLETIQALDLIRRPERLNAILIACRNLATALNSPLNAVNTIEPLLQKIAEIDPKSLIQQGFKGAQLGQEIRKQQLTLCHS